jgi:hypothetical protein
MPEVKIAERKLWVGDVAVPLISGEVHYWRLNPQNWRVVLQRVKEMGISVVATYVCWDFHEISPGKYDFTGETDPSRNLIGFLDLLTEDGFWIIFRPGPYIYSEWKNGGAPDHAAKYHRLDPSFLESAENYMAAVTEVAKPYLATNGGRIVLWQSDNEIDPWPHLYTEELGLASKSGPFQEFLREKYVEVDRLNQAWESDYETFDEARAVTEMFLNDSILMSRYTDYRSFIHWYVNKVASWGVDIYRALGVDVPVYLNTYSGVSTQRWADFEKIADLSGSDIYPSREFLYRANEHRNFLEAVRYSHAISKLPYIAEFQSGIWHDWLEDVGSLSADHYRLMCLSALLAGVAGWNWYMLVNRDNWYQSPINEWGRTRPEIFQAFQQAVGLFNDIDPTTLDKLTNTAVTYDPLQRSTERPGQELLQGLYDADIDYEFWDLSQGTTDKEIAFYAGGNWLSATGQQRLVDYVEDGGHLVCIGAYPKLDEHLHPLNLLDVLAPEGIVSGSPTQMRLSIFDGNTVESPWVSNYRTVPGDAIVVNRLAVKNLPSEELTLQFDLQTGERYTIGYTVSRGKGKITVLGIQPSPELLVPIHKYVDVPITCRSLTAGVASALFQRAGNLYLIAVNPGAEEKFADIELALGTDMKSEWAARDIMTGRDIGVVAESMTISLPRRGGTIIHLYQEK